MPCPAWDLRPGWRSEGSKRLAATATGACEKVPRLSSGRWQPSARRPTRGVALAQQHQETKADRPEWRVRTVATTHGAAFHAYRAATSYHPLFLHGDARI